MSNENEIVDMLESGDLPPHPADTPHPSEEGTLEEGAGDDGAEGDGPLELPPDWQSIDPRVIAQCARQPQNDTGNGRRLLLYFGGKLLNVEEAESTRAAGWHQWTGSHWSMKGGAKAAMAAAQKTGERIALEVDYIDPVPGEKEDDYRARLNRRRQFGVTSGNDGRIKAMLNQATVDNTVAQSKLDADPYSFNVANGTVRFFASETVDPECPDPDVERKITTWSARLDPHNPTDLISKVAPVDYRPGAKAPKFLASLERFQPFADVRDWLQKYYGYGITGLHGEQCLVFHGGGGSNWKSTFTEMIFRVIGDYGATLKIESISGDGQSTGNQASPDIARLPGARLVRSGEPDQGVALKEGLIKAITGGEPMLARHNFGNFFEFYPVFKLSLSGNHKPKIAGVDHGIWRRIRYVIWPVTIKEEEKRHMDEVVAELWEEREGILAWLVEGALKYLAEGLKPPAEIIEATKEYRDEMDAVGPFLDQCTEPMAKPVGGQEPHRVAARTLYDHFVNWCFWENRRAWKEQAFSSAMSQKGFEKARDTKGRWYLNLRMTSIPAMKAHDDDPPHPADDEVPA